VPLHGFKVVVRSAVSVNRITRDFSSEATISRRFVILFWRKFLNTWPITRKPVPAVSKNVQKHVILFVVYIASRWQCNKQGLWSPLSPTEPVQIYLWDIVKDEMYRENSRTEDSLNAGVQNTVFWIRPTKFNVQRTRSLLDATCDWVPFQTSYLKTLPIKPNSKCSALHCGIAQKYSAATFVSLGFHYGKEKFGSHLRC